MKKRKHLRILAAALALLPVLSGCGEEPAVNQGGEAVNQENPASDMETIYLRTEERRYNQEGEVWCLKTWQYDDRGLLLKNETDNGPIETDYDEELGIYTQIIDNPIDGIVNSSLEFEYDDRGGMTVFKQNYEPDSHHRERFEWQYEGDRVMGFTLLGESNGEGGTFPDQKCQFTYDEAGNLTDIGWVKEDGSESRSFKLEYDGEGRLTRETRYEMECDRIYDFIYNDQGLVSELVFSRRPPSRTHGYQEREASELGRTVLEYTKDGQLLIGRGYEYTYDDEGRLISQKNEEQEFTFTYDGNTPVEASGDYVYDENGCLIQAGDTKYEYQAFTLSKEDAARCRRQQQLYLNSAVDYDWPNHGVGSPFGYVIPSPLDPRLLVWPVTGYEK